MGAAQLGARWQVTDPRTRLVLIAGIVLTVAAALFTALAIQARHPTVMRHVERRPAAPATLTDPDGCPAGGACQVVLDPPDALSAAFGHWFPGGQVRTGSRTADAATGRLYRATLVGVVSGATVRLASQCVPGGSRPEANVDQTENASLDLAGDYIVHSVRIVITQPGPAGCSAVVVLDAAPPAPDAEQAATALARDGQVQLRP